MSTSTRGFTLALAVIITSGAMAGCRGREDAPSASLPAAATTSTAEQTSGRRVCDLDRARCERLCKGCDDLAACLEAGGECTRRNGQQVWNQDVADVGDDVFVGGCHFQFTDAACTQNAAFLLGDGCAADGKTIFEWTRTPCHDVCSDSRDCDVECRRSNLGPGVCVRLPNHCGPNMGSAYCKCQLGQPPPPPGPGPNPTATG